MKIQNLPHLFLSNPSKNLFPCSISCAYGSQPDKNPDKDDDANIIYVDRRGLRSQQSAQGAQEGGVTVIFDPVFESGLACFFLSDVARLFFLIFFHRQDVVFLTAGV